VEPTAYAPGMVDASSGPVSVVTGANDVFGLDLR
jgi:hypothetical protein